MLDHGSESHVSFGRLLVISPHLDDGAFGCGDMLAAHPGSVVLSVFAGIPEGFSGLTEWDATCGYLSARHAIISRRREDETALAILGATPIWLSFCDAQYGRTPALDDIARQLRFALGRSACETVLFPLGLFHSDHEIVHEAVLALAREAPTRRWICYEDTFYRHMPKRVADRLERLARAGVTATPLKGVTALASAKLRAVYCYGGQLRGLSSCGRPGHLDALAPESYWVLRVDRA